MKSLTAQMLLGTLLLIPASMFAQTTYTEGLIYVPNAISMFGIGGIDDANQIVGGFEDVHGGYHGWLLSAGTYAQMDLTGLDYVFPLGINSSKGIVGHGVMSGTSEGYMNGSRNPK